jgi:hypothetical protein
LIFDTSDGTLGSPVNGIGESLGGCTVEGSLFSCGSVELQTEVSFTEFTGGEISEVVNSKSVTKVLLVVGNNFVQILLEHTVTVSLFRGGCIRLVVSFNELAELNSILTLGECAKGNGEEGEENK